jgi:tRNA-specific 2-thiouridylase
MVLTPSNTPHGRVRALGLLSGGLDSSLAVCVLAEQGVEVSGLAFRSCFFETLHAEEAASRLGIPLRIIDFSGEHMALVRNPPHGYGKCMNPCIDCHALMLRHAGGLMEAEGYDFIFTGEVLGERPMSQNRQALAVVAEESGYADYVLRPLSAQHLPPTKPEREGLVDRSRLLAIRGRSRKPQMQLAAKYRLTEYPTPAGGCRLTDPNFSKRLADLFQHSAAATPRDVELLKLGRHFRLSPSVKVVMGRNRAENEQLLALRRPGELHLVVLGPPGPDVIIPGTDEVSDDHLLLAARLTVTYSDAPADEPATVRLTDGGEERNLLVRALPRTEAQALLI